MTPPRTPTATQPPRIIALRLLLILPMALLALEPAIWLLRSWTNPVYDSSGHWIALACLGLALRSFTSPIAATPPSHAQPSDRLALTLLALTAILRLAGHVVAIHVLAAASLAVDVWALARLARLHCRSRSLSPFGLALLFSASLPIERIVQRIVGFPLQLASTQGACALLDTTFDNVHCSGGIDIMIDTTPILVDLPCSGSSGLVLLATTFVGLATIYRPRLRSLFLGGLLTIASAFTANILRITTLSAGIVTRDTLGIDVLQQPWHDLVGWTFLAIGALPILLWARTAQASFASPSPSSSQGQHGAQTTYTPAHHHRRAPLRSTPLPHHIVTFTIAITALLGISLYAPTPVDTSHPVAPLELPRVLSHELAQPQPLRDQEREFFVRFGGRAARATYGPTTLLAVRTTSPLRHLHGPDECLRGLGYSVQRLGVIADSPLPHALYKATAPDGTAWRVAVTYHSDTAGEATSIAEAVFLWLQSPGSTWSAYERISPWNEPLVHQRFDRALAHHLQFQHSPSSLPTTPPSPGSPHNPLSMLTLHR